MKTQTVTYRIPAMHCPSCEILMKEEIETLPGVKSVKADSISKTVKIAYTGLKPDSTSINEKIQPYNYKVVTENLTVEKNTHRNEWALAVLITIIIAVAFFYFERWLNTNLGSVEGGLAVRNFLLGLIASVSTCAALVGGLLLAQAKNWQDQKLFPYISFNGSRIITFVVLGAALGLVGSTITPSIETSAILVMAASIVMLVLGLQMLDLWSGFNRIKLQLPQFLTADAVDNRSQKRILMPAILGASTFFLPCSFTLSAQLQAVSGASPIRGALVMLAFALGTLPMLLFISFTSHTLAIQAKWQSLFMKVAGMLVIIFALYTFNNQLNLLGMWSLHDLTY